METNHSREQPLPKKTYGTIVGNGPTTRRELACLQGFPLTHLFGKFEVWRHIGNAVPPLVMKAILQHIVKQLRETDVKA